MKKLILFAVIVFSSATAAFATAQAPDVLFYDNKIFDLYSNPLEGLYDEKTRPDFVISQSGGTSSGNWRGYIAYWEIAEDMLYLKAIDSWLCSGTAVQKATGKADCQKVDIKALFGASVINSRVSATWFTGDLKIPDGKQLQYVHMGYGSVHERDIILSIKDGKVTEKKVVDNTKDMPENEMELQRKELEKLKKSLDGKKKIS